MDEQFQDQWANDLKQEPFPLHWVTLTKTNFKGHPEGLHLWDEVFTCHSWTMCALQTMQHASWWWAMSHAWASGWCVSFFLHCPWIKDTPHKKTHNCTFHNHCMIFVIVAHLHTDGLHLLANTSCHIARCCQCTSHTQQHNNNKTWIAVTIVQPHLMESSSFCHALTCSNNFLCLVKTHRCRLEIQVTVCGNLLSWHWNKGNNGKFKTTFSGSLWSTKIVWPHWHFEPGGLQQALHPLKKLWQQNDIDKKGCTSRKNDILFSIANLSRKPQINSKAQLQELWIGTLDVENRHGDQWPTLGTQRTLNAMLGIFGHFDWRHSSSSTLSMLSLCPPRVTIAVLQHISKGGMVTWEELEWEHKNVTSKGGCIATLHAHAHAHTHFFDNAIVTMQHTTMALMRTCEGVSLWCMHMQTDSTSLPTPAVTLWVCRQCMSHMQQHNNNKTQISVTIVWQHIPESSSFCHALRHSKKFKRLEIDQMQRQIQTHATMQPTWLFNHHGWIDKISENLPNAHSHCG